MKKILFFILSLIAVTHAGFAQKGIRIAYVDMEYILENIDDYQKAQAQLEAKTQNWNQEITKLKNEIDALKKNLNNEKLLLTKELIKEREEDILLKENELQEMQYKYFGPEGDLFFYRKQLAKPFQDEAFNAIHEIAKNKRYDFVFNKSSDLIMLYYNKKYDISDLVLKRIIRSRKKKALSKKKETVKTKNAQGTKK